MPIAAQRDLVVLEVTGPDRIEYLDNVTTQRLEGVATGTVAGLLVLDGKGVPQSIAWALVGDDAVTLLVPPDAVDHLMEVVARQTFLAQVTFTRVDIPVTSLAAGADQVPGDVQEADGGPGDDLSQELDGVGVTLDVDSWTTPDLGGIPDSVVLARHAFGMEVLGLDVDEIAGLGIEVDVVPADELSIRSGEPRWGHEVVAGRLPEEYGLLATHVHLAKGCYPGQEPIAHMWMLGKPRRRLALVAVGAEASDADVTGQVDGRGFAFVKPDSEPGEDVTDGVSITGFVAQDRDIVGWTPAQTRRRDRGGTVKLPRRQP